MSQWTERFLSALCLFLVGTWGCASPNDGATTVVEAEVAVSENRPLSEIELERTTFFFDRNSGAAITVAPGTYQVEALDDVSLRLEGDDSFEAVISAAAGTHEEDLPEPVAATDTTAEDELHIVLFSPNGSVLEAVGSYSGVATRGKRAAAQRIYRLNSYRTAARFAEARRASGYAIPAVQKVTYSCPSGSINVQAQMLQIMATPAPPGWEVLPSGAGPSKLHDATFTHMVLNDYRMDGAGAYWNIQCFYSGHVPLEEVIAGSLVNQANAHLHTVKGSFRRKVYTEQQCVKSGDRHVECGGAAND